jgi:hypothetical protein
MHHIGHYINHDDTVRTGDLASGLDGTREAWQQTYNDDYLNPSAGISFQNASREREPSTANKTPPPNLTPAQRALWDFDVRRQIEHENIDFRLRKLHETLAHSNEQLAKAPPTPAPSASSGGFMTRLLKAAVADDKLRQQLQSSANHAARSVREMHKHHQECREGWGRQRWPLLVAVRGWGDPTVPKGAYRRAPQGTREVNFPIYAATWYDQKPLGYYDYVFGGKGGVIYGGGARVGGGMCAGKFDGGNCVAPPPPRPSAGDSSGGGGG